MVGMQVRRGLGEVEWTLHEARSGKPTLRIGAWGVESWDDPIEEANARAHRILGDIEARGASCVIALGAGLGYVYSALRSRTDIPILLWDPFPRLTRSLPIECPPTLPGLRVVHDPDGFRQAISELARPGFRPTFFVHPGYEEVARFEARFVGYAIRSVQAHSRTRRAEHSLVSRRSLDFLRRFPFLRTIQDLEGSLEGQTAILVSAGPSIGLATESLANRSAGVVLAAAQALRVLHEAGVRAEFAVGGDPGDYTGMIQGLECDYGALLADTSSATPFLDHSLERTFLFHLQTPHVHQLAWQAESLRVIDQPIATVSELLLVLAHELGARRFVLVGIDLESSDPRYHFRFKAPAADGSPVWTNATYFHAARYLDWLCPKLVAGGSEVWRVGSGLPIRGARSLSPRALAEMVAERGDFVEPIPRTVHFPERQARVHALLEALLEADGPVPPGLDCNAADIPTDLAADLDSLVGAARRDACAGALRALDASGGGPTAAP